MNIWSILEIEPCRDKKRIQEAYREKLTVTNPEDSEEAFKNLRAAYEEALAYAEAGEVEEEEDLSPLGSWMRRVKDVYASIRKRGSVECWKELLEDEVCVALDTKIEARDQLLSYLSESFRLPQDIWRLLDETFELEELKEELKESVPEGFLEYIFKEKREGTLLPFELFQGDEYAEYDNYISLFYKSSWEINDRALEEAEKTLSELKTLGIYHPYQDINLTRIHLIREEYDEAGRMAEELYDIYPEDSEIILYMGETSYYAEDYEKAETYYEKTLEKRPKEFLALFGKANCVRKRGELEEAKEIYRKMGKEAPDSAVLRHEISQINEEIIEKYEAKRKAGEADAEMLLELGWCYLQNDRAEEGMKLIPEIHPDEAQSFELENLSGRLYLEAGEGEKALLHFKTWEALIMGLGPDAPEKLKEEAERRYIPLYLQGHALRLLDKKEEALQKFEESLSVKLTEEVLVCKASLFFEEERYEEAIEVCNQLEELNPSNTGVFSFRGRALFELGYYQSAYEDLEKWIQNRPYELNPYLYKIEIFLIYKEYDRAREIVSYLESEGVECDQLTVLQARLMEAGDQEADRCQAYELYKEVLERYEKGESDVTKIWQVIYRMAVADEEERSAEFVFKEIEKGLSYKKDYIPLLNYKAHLLRNERREKEAIEVYQEILKYEPEDTRAVMRIADTYFEDRQYEQALFYYQKYADAEQDQTGLINVGRALLELGRLEESKEIMLEAFRMNPEEPSLHHNLGLVHMFLRQYEEAIQYYKEAVMRYDKKGAAGENTRTQLATCYIRTGQIEEALKIYEELRRRTRNPQYYVKMSEVLRHFGNYKEALDMLEKFTEEVQSERLQGIVREKRAEIYLLQGEKRKACRELKKYKHERWRIDLNLASCYILKKDYKKAQEICDWWINRLSDDSEIYRYVVIRKMFMGDVDAARKLAVKGLELLEKDRMSVDTRAPHYAKKAIFQGTLGNYEAAFESIRIAHESVLCVSCKYCFCHDARLETGIVYDMMGDSRKALEIYRECFAGSRADEELCFLIERLERKC